MTPASDHSTVRVMHVIDSLGRSGGAEQQLVGNLQRFKDTRFRHAVLCLYPGAGDTRASEIPDHVHIGYLYGQDDRTRNRVRLIARMVGVMRKHRPDLVHCALPDAALAARVAGRITGTKVVESLVNVSHEPVHAIDNAAVTPAKLALHRAVDWLTMRWVTRFHALSQEVARSWADTVSIPRSKIEVIPRGVDVATLPAPADRLEIRKAILAELDLPEDAFVILNIGRQVPQKGQIYAIRALPAIRDRVPTAIFLSAGSGGSKSEQLRAESEELGVSDMVHLLGVRQDIPELLIAADVFMFPSLYEGLGVSLLQAMGSGLAPITTNRPPMTEVVSHNVTGLLIEPQDESSLAEAVVTLATDDMLRKRLGKAAREFIIAGFDASTVAERLEGFYQAATEKG